MDYVDEVSKQLRRSEHSCFWPEATSSHGSKIGASTVPRTVACLSLPFTFQSLPCDEYAITIKLPLPLAQVFGVISVPILIRVQLEEILIS